MTTKRFILYIIVVLIVLGLSVLVSFAVSSRPLSNSPVLITVFEPYVIEVAVWYPTQEFKEPGAFMQLTVVNTRTGNFHDIEGGYINYAYPVAYYATFWSPDQSEEPTCIFGIYPPRHPWCNDTYGIVYATIFGSSGGQIDVDNFPLYWSPEWWTFNPLITASTSQGNPYP